MGILIAPSGHAKSALLMNIARHAASIEQKTVLFITNELTVNEQTERFLVRMQQPKTDSSGELNFVSLNMIQDDPTLAYKKLTGYQRELNKHLYIYSAHLGQNISGVEEIMKRLKNEYGSWPDLVVIDYIERMSTQTRMDRGREWAYFGQVAKELVWLAKRRNCAIWTAAQTNRGGLNLKVDLSMEHTQSSIQHLQEASLVLGVRKVKAIDAANNEKAGLEFIELKSRHGAMSSRKMVVEVDLSRMYISSNEIKNIREIEELDAEVSSGEKKKIKGQYSVKERK